MIPWTSQQLKQESMRSSIPYWWLVFHIHQESQYISLIPSSIPISHSSLVKSDIFEISHYIPMFSSCIPMNPHETHLICMILWASPHGQAARPMRWFCWPPHIQAGDCFVQCAHCAEKGGSTSDQAPNAGRTPERAGRNMSGFVWYKRLPHSIHWSRILTNKKMLFVEYPLVSDVPSGNLT